MRTTLALGMICLGAVSSVGDADSPRDRSPLAVSALSTNPREAERACAALRARGESGLLTLFEVAEPVLARGPADPAWARTTRAIDRVAAQHDAWASRLYWHTDLDAARVAARASGRPILALRLLGRLDDPLSCANSRFFRIALYPDPRVASLLRERFVLVWETERPAPRITIDYGDGRVLERTITGNSLHEVLDAEGRLVDALPGMWTPAGFRDELERALALEASLRGLAAEARRAALAQAHRSRLEELTAAWPASAIPERRLDDLRTDGNVPRARSAASLAVMKSVSQVMLLEASDPAFGTRRAEERWIDGAPDLLQRAARADAALSPESVALLRWMEGPGSGAPGAGEAGPVGERRFADRVATFEDAIARDQIQNRYRLRRAIHERFASATADEDRDAFHAWVYDAVFMTPKSDPWLGLAPADAFTGIERGGLAAPREARSSTGR